MGEDQIATVLGRIEGKQDALYNEFQRHVAAHEERHRDDRERADARHKVIDEKLDDHASAINQARGAKNLALVLAGGLGAAVAYVAKKIGL